MNALKNKDFTIISHNCVGGVIYHDLGLKFNTPTINLFFMAKDFIKYNKILLDKGFLPKSKQFYSDRIQSC